MLLVHAATFVHLTDLHLDLLFQEGTDPACHVKNQKLKNRNHYGRPKSQCDSPQALVEDTIYQIPTVDCIFFTGDSSRHDRDDIRPTTEQEVKTEISLVASIFQLRNLTVYPTIGNWDIFPQDNIPSGPNKQLQFLSEAWGPFIGHQESFLKGGYYSIYDNNLQMDIISMNTLYWFGYNEEINDCKGKHPGIQQFQWLDQQLSSSKGAILIGHVPPMSLTNRNYLPLCYEQYMDLIFKHQHKIRGQYFGHINSN
ncbi:Metallo-dependent phosphatase-like protein, partial [Gorgonomyces haynaldii]